jgi:hypothetical protein
MIVLSLLMFPAMVIRYNMGFYEMMIVDVPLFLGATMSVCSFYLMSQREVFGDSWRSASATCRRCWPSASASRSTTRRPVLEGAPRHAVGVHPHAQVPRGGRLRRVEAEALSAAT